jgi:hypothetical protein
MRERLRRAATISLLALAVPAASCSRIEDQLLVVSNPGTGQEASNVWAVEPGDDLDDDHRVMGDAVGPVSIVSRHPDGQLLVNALGQAWRGELLLAAGVRTEDPDRAQKVLANRPGDEGTTIAAAAQTQVVMVPRGVFVFDDEGCLLTTEPAPAKRVGTGRCSISDNDRWVASWPADGGAMEIRDLRHDETVTAKGNFTQGVALANDARVLGIDTGDTTSVVKVIDADDGEVVSTGEPAGFLQALPSGPDSRAFVVIAERDGVPSIEWIESDGTTTTVAEGAPNRPLLPANVGQDGIDYLALGEDLSDSTFFHWSPASDEPEKLLAGELTATALTPETTLLTRQVAEGLEFWSAHEGELSDGPHVVLRTDTSQHLQVARALSKDGVAHVEVTGSTGTSYVRVDTEGGDSAVLMKHWSTLSVGAIGEDGTVVVTGTEAPDDTEQQLLVVQPDGEEATRLTSAELFATSLVHEGIVYFTELTSAGEASVWRVPATVRGGGERPEHLWADALLGGAAWEQLGGASETSTVDPVRLGSQSGGGG